MKLASNHATPHTTMIRLIGIIKKSNMNLSIYAKEVGWKEGPLAIGVV
jgi:hypothetical protein